MLGWLSMGYKNTAIAQMLCLESKTVERHISNIFSKLCNGHSERKHPRVEVTLAYLRASGQISREARVDN